MAAIADRSDAGQVTLDDDTIFALSSGRPPAAIAVMRVSGPAAGTALVALAGALPPARRTATRVLRASDGSVLDRALVLWLPGPATATGEDCAELHLHGGRATVAAVERALGVLPGLRPAVAGEFTRRALLNGRIDLAQAEGLADLLAAETEDQRRLAIGAAEGRVSSALRGWHERIAGIAALVEAELDHSDEGDVDVDRGAVVDAILDLAAEIDTALGRPPVERLRDGPTIVLAGPPNSGKSSLFNALCERDMAIVTPIAGTTRDLLEAAVMRRGRPYRLIDTAGIAETNDPIEAEGIARGLSARERADIVLWLGDEVPLRDWVWLRTRADLPNRAALPGAADVSVHWPATVDAVWEEIERRCEWLRPRSDELALTRRHHDLAIDAVAALQSAAAEEDLLLVAEHLRLAGASIANALGRHAPTAVLNALFERFCIGK